MKQCILRLKENRVRRNYTGGKNLDKLQNKPNPDISNRPEEWIASIVKSYNPVMETIDSEGLSRCIYEGKEEYLYNVLNSDPMFWLNKKEVKLGFLFKILDSSMRLHVQAHPTSEFAKKYLNSEFGKLETYYILDCNEEDGYIRMGFQKAPTKEEWREIVEKQDIAKMDACFEKVPVKKGDVLVIPGGIAHAIGENVLMLEIMEPSDLVVRCEFNRNGIEVPEKARFMNKGLDFCLDIFDYTQYSVEEVLDKFRLKNELIYEDDGIYYDILVKQEIAKSFEVRRLKLDNGKTYEIEINEACAALVVNGKCEFIAEEQNEQFKMGEEAFISASVGKVMIKALEQTELSFVLDKAN